ncbi:OLC1v1018550C1 [Oldenlandia corymbosa var. corymbosa]|uniref:OLC1v1018550C1 n=1 Tax=Oldenlandia corymbosa var. corymbosa TaxID=529605 RepID=A0AAV1EBZ5_OLDCO|nr:OLC1v1018550C1 [Oldenlandia corymbosa var. corymbosa]
MTKSLEISKNDPPPIEPEKEVEPEEEDEETSESGPEDAVTRKMKLSSKDKVSGSENSTPANAVSGNIHSLSNELNPNPDQHVVKLPTASKPDSSFTSPVLSTNAGAGANAKRGAAEPKSSTHSKKAKTKTAKKIANVVEDKKLFERIFSEDDEILILEGIADFSAKAKADPLDKITEFHDYINKKIGGDKTKSQLLDKMKRLKKRYENIAAKAQKLLKKGKQRTFADRHTQNVYDLSKKIWGRDVTGDEEVKRSGNRRVSVEFEELRKGKSSGNEKERILSFVPNDVTVMENWFLHEGTQLMEEDDKETMEKKWKEFKLEECELWMKKQKLMIEHMEKVKEGIKSLGN